MSFLQTLEKIRIPILDVLMQGITFFGEELVIICVVCTLYWCVNKRFAYLLALNYFVAGLFVQTLKITFRIPRPWILDPNFKAVESALPGATGYSFPSGHTQGATSLYTNLALRSKKGWLKIVFSCAFLLVGFSRMYLGVHTPKDVLVSMTLSLVVAFIIWYKRYPLLKYKHTKKVALGLFILSLGVLIYASILATRPGLDLTIALDAFKAAGAGTGFALGWYLERTKLKFSTRCPKLSLQGLKLGVGLLTTALLKVVLGLLPKGNPAFVFSAYFVLILWIIFFYPFIFKFYLNKRKHS
ncbi:membrane-associated phospholipid phosphatase [Lachnospiraceae bacterium PFB1-21]